MAQGKGWAILNFGTGSNEASVVVTGQTTISATSNADTFLMADDTTTDHSASDHRYLAMLAGFTCGTPVAGTSFTIYATSLRKLAGTFKVRWVWSD